MNFLSFVIFPMLIVVHGVTTEGLYDSRILSTGYHKIAKREDTDAKSVDQNSISQKEFINFVEEKLVQHSQALEHLLKLVNEAVAAVKTLAENIGQNLQEPKLPEKIELSKHKNSELKLEKPSGAGDESHRSHSKNSIALPNLSNSKSTSSPWCSVAVLCNRTGPPVCGYDDSYGYGKFDDFCHLVQVNCYFDYNFSLVPNCSSSS